MGTTVVAEYKGNEIDILSCDYLRLMVVLNDSMMDLDRPVIVRYQGETIFQGPMERSIANLSCTLALRGNLRYMFPAVMEVRMP